MTPAARIRHLVEAGRVSRDEGERLVAALGPAPTTRSLRSLAINPFDRFGGGTALVAGLGIGGASLLATRLGAHFDGFMDMHASNGTAAPIGASLLEQAASWLLPALLFWGYARAMNPHVRLVDFVGFVGLARLPLLIDALFVIAVGPVMPPGPPHLTPILVLVALVSLPLLAWCGTLLFTGFRNASGLPRGSGKLIGGFAGLLVVSEVVSKGLLFLLPRF
jgi:Yip1 domain